MRITLTPALEIVVRNDGSEGEFDLRGLYREIVRELPHAEAPNFAEIDNLPEGGAIKIYLMPEVQEDESSDVPLEEFGERLGLAVQTLKNGLP